MVHQGSHSGYQALGLAHRFIELGQGAPKIILLGYDCRTGRTGRHYFGDHPQGLVTTRSYMSWLKRFATIAPVAYGLEIINCTPGSAMTWFPMGRLEDHC